MPRALIVFASSNWHIAIFLSSIYRCGGNIGILPTSNASWNLIEFGPDPEGKRPKIYSRKVRNDFVLLKTRESSVHAYCFRNTNSFQKTKKPKKNKKQKVSFKHRLFLSSWMFTAYNWKCLHYDATHRFFILNFVRGVKNFDTVKKRSTFGRGISQQHVILNFFIYQSSSLRPVWWTTSTHHWWDGGRTWWKLMQIKN